jgi:hypothetical protein
MITKKFILISMLLGWASSVAICQPVGKMSDKLSRDSISSAVEMIRSNAVQTIIDMQHAYNRYDLHALRSTLNMCVMKLAIIDARQNGQKTVGVVIPKYKAVVDAENSGTNLVESLAVLGIQWTGDWSTNRTYYAAIIEDVYAGVKPIPSEAEMTMIELYMGVEGYNAFVERYNNL